MPVCGKSMSDPHPQSAGRRSNVDRPVETPVPSDPERPDVGRLPGNERDPELHNRKEPRS